MSATRLKAFAAMVPRTARHLLQDTQAQVATNARLTSGALEPLHDTLLRNIPGTPGLKSVHRIVDAAGNEFFLGWDVDVDVAIGPIAGDETFRRYFTGDNEPRVTNLALANSIAPYPHDFFVLGVFPPRTAADLVHAGGAGTAVARAVVYTFVTQWGEESQPSPPTAVITGKVDGTWTIGGVTPMDVAPPNSFAITGASWAAGISTVNVASTFGLRVGEEIKVTGMNPAGYNAAGALITAIVANTSVSYALAANPGAFVAGGTLARIASHNTTGMTKRIYWTETTVSGTKFQFVKEIPVATTSTTVAGNTVAGEVIPSIDWPMPPVTMRGITLHPSGAMVGFDGNELLFSDVFIPYAYPEAFKQILDFKIVGIGVVGTTVVVATEGRPYLVAGNSPEVMSPEKVDRPWPCLSKRGIASLPWGVAYPCPQGLAVLGVSAPALLSDDIFKQEQWTALNPSSFIAACHSGRYIVSRDIGMGNRALLLIDKTEFAACIAANKNCQALYAEVGTGVLYVVIDDKIHEWDSISASFIIYDWMSKEFVLPKPMNLGAAKVDADFSLTAEETAAISAARAAVEALNVATIAAGTYEGALGQTEFGVLEIGGVDLLDLPLEAADKLQFQLWTDNKLRFTKTLTGSRAFKLPDGYKSDHIAVRITGTVKVSGVVLAPTMKELEEA